MKLALLLLLVGYAHVLDPKAECDAVTTAVFGDREDTAVCVSGREIRRCTNWGAGNFPECLTVRTITPEKP